MAMIHPPVYTSYVINKQLFHFRLAAKKEMQNKKLQERLDEMKKKKERDMAASRALTRVDDDEMGHTNEGFEDLEKYWISIKVFCAAKISGNSRLSLGVWSFVFFSEARRKVVLGQWNKSNLVLKSSGLFCFVLLLCFFRQIEWKYIFVLESILEIECTCTGT